MRLASWYSLEKECTKLGSDLNEVQSVVNVVFPNMTEKVDEFSKKQQNSRLVRNNGKKYVGLFGSMAKQFNFTESQAYDMSTQLTQLAGDVASLQY